MFIAQTTLNQFDPDCAVLELTLACNLACIHCGGSAGSKREDELSLSEIKTIAQDLKTIKFKRVSLIGGEPFARKDWYEAAKIIKNEGLGITFVSNGYLLPNNELLIKKIKRVGPQVVGLSLDGGTAGTHDKIRGVSGSFQKVLESIDLLQDKGINVTIITTVSKLNIHELPIIRDMMLDKNVGWQIQIASINGSRFNSQLFISQAEYIEVAKFIHNNVETYSQKRLPIAGTDDIGYFSKKYPFCSINQNYWQGCKAGITNIGIQSNGNVKGCDALPDAFVEGNIRRERLIDIWTNPHSFAYTRKFDPQQLKGCCNKCPYGVKCKGGCVDIAISISGHPFENYYCLYHNGV